MRGRDEKRNGEQPQPGTATPALSLRGHGRIVSVASIFVLTNSPTIAGITLRARLGIRPVRDRSIQGQAAGLLGRLLSELQDCAAAQGSSMTVIALAVAVAITVAMAIAVAITVPVTMIPAFVPVVARVSAGIAAIVRDLKVSSRNRHRGNVESIARIAADEQHGRAVRCIDAEVKAIRPAPAAILGACAECHHAEIGVAPAKAFKGAKSLEFNKPELRPAGSVLVSAAIGDVKGRALETQLKGTGDDVPFAVIGIGAVATGQGGALDVKERSAM